MSDRVYDTVATESQKQEYVNDLFTRIKDLVDNPINSSLSAGFRDPYHGLDASTIINRKAETLEEIHSLLDYYIKESNMWLY